MMKRKRKKKREEMCAIERCYKEEIGDSTIDACGVAPSLH